MKATLNSSKTVEEGEGKGGKKIRVLGARPLIIATKTIRPIYGSVRELLRDITIGPTMRLPFEVYKVRVKEEPGNRIVYILKFSRTEYSLVYSPTDYSGSGRKEYELMQKLEERWRKNNIPIHEYTMDGKLFWALYNALKQDIS